MAEVLIPQGVFSSKYWSAHEDYDDCDRLNPLPEDPDLRESVSTLLQEYKKNPNTSPIQMPRGFLISQRSLSVGTIVRISYERMKPGGDLEVNDRWRDYYQSFKLWGVICNFLDNAMNEEMLLCFQELTNGNLYPGPAVQLPITTGETYHEGLANSQFLFKVGSLELHRRT